MNAQAGNPELVRLVRETIRRDGPVSFAWFMEKALYHPDNGYYSSGRAHLGRRGDYFTNVSVGPLFGKLLAVQFAEIWEQLGNPGAFIVVEQGGHEGDLARDVLQSLRENAPECFAALRYRLVEPFSVLRNRQAEALAEFREKIDWCDSVETLEPFVGIHFSNELLDAFPVRLIVSVDNGAGAVSWKEKCVTLKGDEFLFVEQPITDPVLRAHLKKASASSETEINLVALDWIDKLSSKLQRGVVLVIDYGFTRDELGAPHRAGGTLQCRAQHRLLSSPFEQIGEADITAHIDWTSLSERAEECGLRLNGFADQHHFLTGIISRFPKIAEDADPKTRRALQTLLHPEMLGRSFQVLALGKNFDARQAGFRYAREPRATVGLS